jgi:hypothetical protein
MRSPAFNRTQRNVHNPNHLFEENKTMALTAKKLQGLPKGPAAQILAEVNGSIQSLSGAGAVNLTTATTRYTSTGAAQALTLADATVTGHKKRIIHCVDGGSGVLTAGGALHLADSIATITFTNVRDWVDLEWNGSAWAVTAYAGVTFA